ncbi:MAG: AsmA family protein, partial [Candidatus Omnitrophica bacterium]|nr:AsmA family protein [Candidatus Omnitrophota bacterium]
MRKVLVGIAFFIVAIFIGLIILVKTIDLNRYLPQIVQMISQAVKRDVSVGKLTLNFSLKQGVFVDVAQVSLSDDALFSKTPFISIDHVHIGVSVLPLIIKRQIEIISIDIQSLQITLIKNEQGSFNYESMLPKKSATPPAPTEFKPGNLPKLLVNSFTITDARVGYKDLSQASSMNVSVGDIDARVVGFSLQEPFKLALDAAVFSSNQDLHLDASGRIDVQLQQARFDDVHFNFDLSRLDTHRLSQEIPATVSLGLGKDLAGSVQAVISQMVVGVKGLLVLSLDGKLEGVQIPLKMLSVPISGLGAKVDMTESRVRISDFTFNLSSGKISGQFNVNDYLTAQNFELDLAVNQLLVEDVINQEKSPARMKGTLSGSAHLKGRGFSGEAANQILGQAQVGLSDGQLVNINIVKSILQKIPLLSSIEKVAGSQLSQGAEQLLGSNSTKIGSAQIKSRIENANIILDDVQVNSDDFLLAAHGNVDFNQTVQMTAKLSLSQDASASLIKSAGDMKALMDENKQIQFPVNISGKIPNLNYVPDMAYISKLLLVNKGGNELKKVLDKNPKAKDFLDILTGGADSNNSSEPAEESAGDQETPSQKPSLFRSILEKA